MIWADFWLQQPVVEQSALNLYVPLATRLPVCKRLMLGQDLTDYKLKFENGRLWAAWKLVR